MRIVYDGYWWESGPPSGHMLSRQIALAWCEAFPNDELIIATPDAPSLPDATRHKNMRFIRTRAGRHPIINSFELPILRRTTAADAIVTHNFAPIDKASIVFVQDVLFQSNPEWFSLTERAYLSMIPHLLPRAGAVLASSKNEAARIARYNPKVREPRVCGLAVSQALLTSAPRPPEPAPEGGNFFLCVGRLNVRKNLVTALHGLLASGYVSPQSPVLVVGQPSGRIELEDRKVAAAIADGLVRFVGFLPDEELRWLYENCRLFVFLSLDEGYGLPPIEALALGARVLVSDIPVFHELLGTEASYVDPRSVAAVARAVPAALTRRLPQSRADDSWHDVADRIRLAVDETIGKRDSDV